jgi:hypothetical protein
MKRRNLFTLPTAFPILLAILLFGSTKVSAHCDGMDGPVVTAAKKALATGNVNLVLIWVQKKDEDEIKKAFRKTLVVQKGSPEARELADMYFFETLVRIHRAGEGAPFTGLKPAGRDLGPAIPAGDKAIADGKVEPLLKLLINAIQQGLHDQFKKAMAKKNFDKDDVDAGREYIEAYVSYIHYVERLYEAAQKPSPGHYPESEEGEGHKH